ALTRQDSPSSRGTGASSSKPRPHSRGRLAGFGGALASGIGSVVSGVGAVSGAVSKVTQGIVTETSRILHSSSSNKSLKWTCQECSEVNRGLGVQCSACKASKPGTSGGRPTEAAVEDAAATSGIGDLNLLSVAQEEEVTQLPSPSGDKGATLALELEPAPVAPLAVRPSTSGGALDMAQAVIPDEMALHLGIQFNDPADRVAYHILKPLFVQPLPLPWQVFRRHHGRFDFHHSGLKEYRRRHPLFAFFGELLEFLRAHTHTNIPITEPLTAQVFKEASPQVIRERLGFWEGPLQDSSTTGGIIFDRRWQGYDEACPVGSTRHDDPRLEAAANIATRLAGWLHLWKGFAPQEPFPLLEGRIAALAQQLGECVVTAPGAATAQMQAHMEGQLPKLEEPEEPKKEEVAEAPPPPTAEEEAMYPLVTDTLGKAFGSALHNIGLKQAQVYINQGLLPGDTVSTMARVMCSSLYQAAEKHVARYEEDELSPGYTEGEEEEFDEESEQGEEEEKALSSEGEQEEEEAEEEEQPGVEEAAMAEEPEEPEQEEAEPAEPEKEEEEEKAQKEKQPEEPEEKPAAVGFLVRKESAADWASRTLRPMTPDTGRRPEEIGTPKLSPHGAKPPLHRQRLGCGEHIWSQTAEGFFSGASQAASSQAEAAAPEAAAPEAAEPEAAEPEAAEDQEDQQSGDITLLLGDAEEGQEDADAEDADADAEGQEDADAEEYAQDEYEEEEEGEELWPPEEVEEGRPDTALPPEKEAQVSDFSRSLQAATSFFDQALGDQQAEFDELAGTSFWRRKEVEPERPEMYSTGRSFLKMADMPPKRRGSEPTLELQETFENVTNGCAARPGTPSRVMKTMPQPPHLEGAKPPPMGSSSGSRAFPCKPGARPSSAGARMERFRPPAKRLRAKKGAPSGEPKDAKLLPRPHSATARLRPRRQNAPLLPQT
ncbi:unnamed protein product, partial [Polarella glacialis]